MIMSLKVVCVGTNGNYIIEYRYVLITKKKYCFSRLYKNESLKVD